MAAGIAHEVNQPLNGIRNISKKALYKIEEEHGKLEVGAYVEVEGVAFEGKFIASEIETKKKK